MWSDFWIVIGPWIIAAIGGAIGAALLLPTKLGEALFKYRFDKAIEAFKAEQGTKLERLREQLSHVGDRGRRSNEMEFAAIREVWEKTVEAFLATGNCAANMIEYPDLGRMPSQELEAFLSTTGFSSEQNDQIIQAADHNDMYVKIVTWRSIADAGQKNFAANLLLRKQRIFMPNSMHSEFQSVIDLLNKTQVERKLQFQHPHIPRGEWGGAVNRFFSDGDAALEKLAGIVNQRLFRNEV
jgi:hypothetical protein